MALDEKAIEKYVDAQLKPAGLSEAQLARVRDGVLQLYKLGVKPNSVFPYGIILNDAATVHADLDTVSLGRLVEWLGTQPGGALERFEVFPKGIPVVDGFATRIRLR